MTNPEDAIIDRMDETKKVVAACILSLQTLFLLADESVVSAVMQSVLEDYEQTGQLPRVSR